MKKAVFLDRDGVINRVTIRDGNACSPQCPKEFRFKKDISLHIRTLKKAGFLILVVTNQPDITRGKMSMTALSKMNDLIRNRLTVDDIFVCIHDDQDNCLCRKPKPGMLFDAAERYNIDLRRSYLIGDGWRDMEAARNAGCHGILIRARYNRELNYSPHVRSIKEAVDLIVMKKEVK